MKIKINKEKICIIIIVIIALCSRIYLWPNVIDDVNCDEAMTALNAKAIAETGKDMYGTSMPVYFETWLWGGQSALLTYFMAICIKIFGFNIFAIRLPMLIVSIISIFIFYKFMQIVFENKKITLITTFLLAINPWHIMQSVWSLDCNMFPHFLLFSIYILTKGVKEQKNILIYFSMLFFGITTYSYGIALYVVPLFLVIYMLVLLKSRSIKWKTVMISALILTVIALPLILMAIINLFPLQDLKLGIITIQHFDYLTRTSDMIVFSKNIIEQWLNNIEVLFELILVNSDNLIWNAIPNVGTVYMGSFIFAIIGLMFLIKDKTIKNKNIILIWMIVSLLIGILINDVNVNRLNVIWYPFIILIGFGIYKMLEFLNFNKICITIVAIFYAISFCKFNYSFYNEYCEKIANSSTWSKGLVNEIRDNINTDEELFSKDNILKNEKNIVFTIYALDYNFKECGFLDKKILLNTYLGTKNNEFIDLIKKQKTR